MIELRMRSQISEEELEQKIGRILVAEDYNVLLTGDARVLKPNGQTLCVYKRGALSEELLNNSYATLHSLRSYQTDNRGLASGSLRVQKPGVSEKSRTRSKKVRSAIIGAFDGKEPYPFCRLTAWSGQQWEKYNGLFPLFQRVGEEFAAAVPERYQAQMSYVERTRPEWVIRGTPFTTITVNNTYPTGVHTDKGDLDEGFSCLAVLRYGSYSGGCLVFPRYRVAVDMQHGDVLLMDAHEFHGNSAMELEDDAERISVVAYYRSNMAECDSRDVEAQKALARYNTSTNRRDAELIAGLANGG